MGHQLCSQGREKPPVKVLSCRSGLFNHPEFILAEAMGTEVPRRCPACRNCKECQFCMDSLTFKENAEYKVKLSKLYIMYSHQKIPCLLYSCFRKINHLVPVTICIHPLM